MWLSKWITETGPHFSYVDLRAESVVVWSPPRVMMRGTGEVLLSFAGREEMTL